MGMGAAGCAAPPQCRCAQLPAEGRQWPLRRCCQYKRKKRTRCVRFFVWPENFQPGLLMAFLPVCPAGIIAECAMPRPPQPFAAQAGQAQPRMAQSSATWTPETRHAASARRRKSARPAAGGTSCGQNRSYTRCAAQGRNISSICSIHGGSSSLSSGGGAPCAPGSKPCSSMRAPSIRHNLNVRHSPRARQKACRYHALLL